MGPAELLDADLVQFAASDPQFPEEGNVVEEIEEAVFQFKCLKPEICEALLFEIEAFLEWQQDKVDRGERGAAYFNARLCVLDHLPVVGPHILDILKSALVDRVAPLLFPEVCERGNSLATSFAARYSAGSSGSGGANPANPATGSKTGGNNTAGAAEAAEAAAEAAAGQVPPDMDYRFGFAIGYAADLAAAEREGKARNVTRTALDWHTDDSEITLTIRLGREFSGGEVVLRGFRGSTAPGTREGEVQRNVRQRNGEATLFFGQQNHEVLPVLSGERQMLIVWFRSSFFRTRTCPCCRTYRRFGKCVLRDAIGGAE